MKQIYYLNNCKLLVNVGKRNMVKLSSTSALVLLWAKDKCYKSKNAKDYLSLLDLSSGKKLYEECHKIWQFYDEVIISRKFGVLNLIHKVIADDTNISQIIIAGAGLDALGIEVISFYPNIKVFELDNENMDAKSEYASKVERIQQSQIAFLNANLQNIQEVIAMLQTRGWNPNEDSLLIMEGISYYLTPTTAKKLIEVIKPKRMVFEFLKQKEDVDFKRAIIADKVFGLISNQCDCPEIVRYNYSKIGKVFNLSILTKYSMKQLELERTGTNRHFLTENSGWIDICLLEGKF